MRQRLITSYLWLLLSEGTRHSTWSFRPWRVRVCVCVFVFLGGGGGGGGLGLVSYYNRKP